jgi:adenine phosphoribosyltransferase
VTQPVVPSPRAPKALLIKLVQTLSGVQTVWNTGQRGLLGYRPGTEKAWVLLGLQGIREYGTDELELHTDAVSRGARVVVVDDLIATGGTAGAACTLLERVGGVVVGASFVINLPDLGGAAKLAAAGVEVRALVSFPGH